MRAYLLAAGIVGAAAWWAWRQRDSAPLEESGDAIADAWDSWADDSGGYVEEVGSVLSDAAITAREFIDSASGGLVKVSAMRSITGDVASHPNVRAMLRVIREGEGTADEAGYSRLFGGGQFASFADHPRVVIRKSGYTTTAAGAYQFLSSTWDETREMMGLRDFSPASQDLAAVGRMAARGALTDILNGKFTQAVAKLGREWASLPGSPYGQPTISATRARQVYAAAGGASSDTIMA